MEYSACLLLFPVVYPGETRTLLLSLSFPTVYYLKTSIKKPEGWVGEGDRRGNQDGGTHVHPWLIHVSVWQKPSHYRKVIILQLK